WRRTRVEVRALPGAGARRARAGGGRPRRSDRLVERRGRDVPHRTASAAERRAVVEIRRRGLSPHRRALPRALRSRDRLQGLIVPAEWEKHRATWLAWPHNVRDWPGKFGPIPWVYAEIVRRVAECERGRLLGGSPESQARA